MASSEDSLFEKIENEAEESGIQEMLEMEEAAEEIANANLFKNDSSEDRPVRTVITNSSR